MPKVHTPTLGMASYLFTMVVIDNFFTAFFPSVWFGPYANTLASRGSIKVSILLLRLSWTEPDIKLRLKRSSKHDGLSSQSYVT
jgi:hypothetical protein